MADDDNEQTPDSQDASPAPELGEDAIAAALVNAFLAKDVQVPDDGMKVSQADGLFHLSVRLSADVRPLPQIPDDTGNLAPGSQEGATLMVLGTVQLVDTQTRVTMRIVVVETSEILESSSGDADGVSEESVGNAAESAISDLSTLSH